MGSLEFPFLLKAQNMGQVALVVDYFREELQLPESFFPGALSQQVSCRLLQTAGACAPLLQHSKALAMLRCCWDTCVLSPAIAC